jgi:pyruvate dehydrogenase E1 component alpha subunit
MPDPQPLSLFDHVYSGGNAILAEERDQYAAYLASFAAEGGTR